MLFTIFDIALCFFFFEKLRKKLYHLLLYYYRKVFTFMTITSSTRFKFCPEKKKKKKYVQYPQVIIYTFRHYLRDEIIFQSTTCKLYILSNSCIIPLRFPMGYNLQCAHKYSLKYYNIQYNITLISLRNIRHFALIP